MSAEVKHLLEVFEALGETEKEEAVVEILRRNPVGASDLTAKDFDTLADELFSQLDAEEGLLIFSVPTDSLQ
jgi:hypothetical protein